MSSIPTQKYRSASTRILLTACLCISSLAPVTGSSLLPAGGPLEMTIDLLPGNEQNTIDLGRQRLVSVAILGSASLDVNDVNPRTLSLKAVSQKLVGKSDKSLCRQQDINADSYMDLICDIKTIGYRVQPGDIPVIIAAGTYQRQSLRAEGILRYQAE